MAFFDLASLTKTLVTAPLALQHLDLDRDRRDQLSFQDRQWPLTVRRLLSHSAGLPAWLPYTGEPLAEQLNQEFPEGMHPLFRQGAFGKSLYSDLGYRLVAELLEQELEQPFAQLGEGFTGLLSSPWTANPVPIPDGPDVAAWRIAEPLVPVPARKDNLPHDANARAGMSGHAGFGCTGQGMKAWLERWVGADFPARMAHRTARAEDGTIWGLGLHRVCEGEGRFGDLLGRGLGSMKGIHVLEESGTNLPAGLPPVSSKPGRPTPFWMHLGYTGPALFVRPSDGFCICLLLHRQGPTGELLGLDTLRARRWRMLEAFLGQGNLGA